METPIYNLSLTEHHLDTGVVNTTLIFLLETVCSWLLLSPGVGGGA